jgi:hypothetical protein
MDPLVRERVARLRSFFYPVECRPLKSASSPLILLSATSFLLLAFASLLRARLSFVSLLLALIPECEGPCLGLAATVWSGLCSCSAPDFVFLLEDFLLTAALVNLFIHLPVLLFEFCLSVDSILFKQGKVLFIALPVLRAVCCLFSAAAGGSLSQAFDCARIIVG